MKRFLKIAAVVLAVPVVLVLALVAVFLLSKAGNAHISDGFQRDGVEVVRDGFVDACIVTLANGEVALIDAGDSKDAGALLAALRKRGLGPESVTAILLTHGDSDHAGGVLRFPKATVMVLEPDVALAEGKASRIPLVPAKLTGFQVGRVLKDGEVLELGGVRFEVFAVPGHTPGSAAILARGALFLGDSAESTSGGKLGPANWLTSADRALNRKSLRELAARLAPRSEEIKILVPSHSGVLERGLVPLSELAEERKD